MTCSTPGELYGHVAGLLARPDLDQLLYEQIMDWCCMAAHAGMDVIVAGRILSFIMPAVLRTMEHLHMWAQIRPAHTLKGSQDSGPDCLLTDNIPAPVQQVSIGTVRG
jgi:hypothetical protein